MASVKRIGLFGATGSIGTSTLALLKQNPDAFALTYVTANTQAEKLARIAIEHDAEMAIISDPECYEDLKKHLAGTSIKALAGQDALVAAGHDIDCDIVVAGIIGAAGLAPTWSCLEKGRTIALANKECLVCAGQLFMDTARQYQATLLPVDSEHNAIFQLLEHQGVENIEKIILTASGGPFLHASHEELAQATPEMALKHPQWSMGAKITIDSATMMNKGFEIIEAHHLFGLAREKLDILVHPQSIVHGLISLVDGSIIAHLSPADMRIPIAHCLFWPEKESFDGVPLDLSEIAGLNFLKADHQRFKALDLCFDALNNGDGYTNVLNAANEVAVHAFLNKKISFLSIPDICSKTLEKAEEMALVNVPETLEDVLSTDKEARHIASSFVR